MGAATIITPISQVDKLRLKETQPVRRKLILEFRPSVIFNMAVIHSFNILRGVAGHHQAEGSSTRSESGPMLAGLNPEQSLALVFLPKHFERVLPDQVCC